MKLVRKVGATSEIWQIFIQDSSSTTGAGLTGLTNASSGLTAYYHRDTDTTATAISLVTMTAGTFTSSGFKEIDSTNMPGWYQFCPPNAAIASGAKSCGFHLKGATNMAPLPIEVQLVSYDPDDTVRLGLTALPNVASGSAGAIPTTGTGSNQISVSSGQVIIQAGSGTGQLDFTSGVVKANVTQFGGAAATTASGRPEVNVSHFGGSAGTFASGRPEVNTTHLAGTISAGTAGYVALDWAHMTGQATSQNLSATTINLCNTITTYTGNTVQTGDAYARIGAAGAGLTALGDTRIANLDATVSSRLATSGYTTPPTAAQNFTACLTTQLTEAYASLHTVPTLAQAIFEIRSLVAEKSVGSTTLTAKKIDGSTTAGTYTLDSATAPTSITRAS